MLLEPFSEEQNKGLLRRRLMLLEVVATKVVIGTIFSPSFASSIVSSILLVVRHAVIMLMVHITGLGGRHYMCSLVRSQIWRLSKALVAVRIGANVGLFSSMRAQVSAQVEIKREPLPAYLAFIWFFTLKMLKSVVARLQCAPAGDVWAWNCPRSACHRWLPCICTSSHHVSSSAFGRILFSSIRKVRFEIPYLGQRRFYRIRPRCRCTS